MPTYLLIEKKAGARAGRERRRGKSFIKQADAGARTRAAHEAIESQNASQPRSESYFPESFLLAPHPGGNFIGRNLAVADVDDPMGILGDVRLVGHHDDGIAFGVQFIDKRHDLHAGL